MTIVGPALVRPGTFVYDEVKRVATALAEIGCDIITGGGLGLKRAANEGAAAVDARLLREHHAKWLTPCCQ